MGTVLLVKVIRQLISRLRSWVLVTLIQSLQETSVAGSSTIGRATPGWFLLISFMNHRLKRMEEWKGFVAGGPTSLLGLWQDSVYP